MTGRVTIKAGVRLDPLTPALIRLLAMVDEAARAMGREFVVTCGREGHPPTDPHTRGAAIDVRSAGLPEATISVLFQRLRGSLGGAFTVLYEVPRPIPGFLAAIASINPDATAAHFHLQVRRGTVWPPEGDA